MITTPEQAKARFLSLQTRRRQHQAAWEQLIEETKVWDWAGVWLDPPLARFVSDLASLA